LIFQRLLKKFGEDESLSGIELDEASAILHDVHDYILGVKKMTEDWIKTIDDPFRKRFLSPAKRSLVYADTTLDLPVMVFNDFIIVFDIDKDEEEGEVYSIIEKFPLALVDVEEKGKNTVFRCPTLGTQCQCKSPNNRAGNNLRKKISEAKSRLTQDIVIEMTKLRSFSPEFSTINCCIPYKDELILGTREGIYTVDLNDSSKKPRKIANTHSNILKMDLSKNLELILYLQEDTKLKTTELYSYPLLALQSSNAVQVHMYPEIINTNREKVSLFASQDLGSAANVLLYSSKQTISKMTENHDVAFEMKHSQKLETTPSFISYVNRELYIGATPKILKLADEDLITIYESDHKLIPLDCLIIDEFHLFCYGEHGTLYNTEIDSVVSTLVWTDTARRFGLLGNYLLVFTLNYVEVRHKESLWQVKQILPAAKHTMLDIEHLYLFTGSEIQQLQLLK